MTRLHVGAGALLLTSYENRDFDSPLKTEQCNAFLELCKAEIVNQCNTKDALAAVFTLLRHMESTCQPPANIATYVLVTQSLGEQVHHGDLSDQVLLQLYIDIFSTDAQSFGDKQGDIRSVCSRHSGVHVTQQN